MDIWGWVENRYDTLNEEGHSELASYIYDISKYACDDRSDLVDQIFQQALPLCRSLEDNWLELYFRHWRLQSHVLKSYRAKDLLSEAISLLEFSHREETKDCPQRICAVQDLAACYGIKDGPGYAEERIAVCKETIAEIDGSWPCFDCINSELLDALMDAERYDELQEELIRIDSEFAKYKDSNATEIIITRGRLLLQTGEIGKAKNLIETTNNPGGGSGFVRSQKLLLALIYCAENRWAEAKQLVANYSETSLECKYLDDWTNVQFKLANAGEIPNNRQVRQSIHYAAQLLEKNGSLRVSFSVLDRLIQLGVAAEDTYRLSFVLEEMKALRMQFNRDMGAEIRVSEIEKILAGVATPRTLPTFDSAENLLGHEFENETTEFLSLQTGLENWPDNMQILRRQCTLLDSCFQREKSYAMLANAHAKQPDNPMLEHDFGNAFLRKHGFEGYTREFPFSHLEELSKPQIWNRGYIYFKHYKSYDTAQALWVLQTIEQHWPEDPSLLGDIAAQLIKSNEFAEALRYRLRQKNADPKNSDTLWDVCIAATLAKDFTVLLNAAAELDLQVTPEGLFEPDKQSRIRLQGDSEKDGAEMLYATRTGPVLARVDTVSKLNTGNQVYGQSVVFDPAPLNRLTEKDEDGYACDKEGYYNYLYPSIHVLADPQYRTFAIDGIDPGEEAIDLLRKQIEEAGLVFSRRSGEHYRIRYTEGRTERDAQGIYAYILADPEASLNELNNLLQAFSNSLDHPLVWTKLCEEIGDKGLLEIQRELCAKYGITDE